LLRCSDADFSNYRAMAGGVHTSLAVEHKRPANALLLGEDHPGRAHSEVSGSGSIFAFVPAHSGSRASAVAQQLSRTFSEGLGVTVLLADFDRRGCSVCSATETPKRLDHSTWGAFVSEVNGIPVLKAPDVKPRQLGRLLDYARRRFPIVCADLTGASEAYAVEILRASASIFVVSGSDAASLQAVRGKMNWLRSLNLADEAGLLLEHTPHGANAGEAEEKSGVPVCSLVENAAQITQLATWLALNALAANEAGEPLGAAVELAQAV
jgi:Flp pilus assembly CpaE family ATPase